LGRRDIVGLIVEKEEGEGGEGGERFVRERRDGQEVVEGWRRD
jgi:hypothetical protein